MYEFELKLYYNDGQGDPEEMWEQPEFLLQIEDADEADHFLYALREFVRDYA